MAHSGGGKLPVAGFHGLTHKLVVLGLAGANLLVCLVAVFALYQSKLLYEKAAETLTQNIASAIDLNCTRDMQKVDLALQSVIDDLERQLAGPGLQAVPTERMLASIEKRLPEVEAIRVARADGQVIFGKGVRLAERANWADREPFAYLRDHPEAGLQISGPVVGRISSTH